MEEVVTPIAPVLKASLHRIQREEAKRQELLGIDGELTNHPRLLDILGCYQGG